MSLDANLDIKSKTKKSEIVFPLFNGYRDFYDVQ